MSTKCLLLLVVMVTALGTLHKSTHAQNTNTDFHGAEFRDKILATPGTGLKLHGSGSSAFDNNGKAQLRLSGMTFNVFHPTVTKVDGKTSIRCIVELERGIGPEKENYFGGIALGFENGGEAKLLEMTIDLNEKKKDELPKIDIDYEKQIGFEKGGFRAGSKLGIMITDAQRLIGLLQGQGDELKYKYGLHSIAGWLISSCH